MLRLGQTKQCAVVWRAQLAPLVCVRVSEVYGVPRHDLAGLTRLAPVFKHELLGSFRVAGAPNNQRRTDGSAKDNVAGEPITWNPRHSHMIEELLHRCRPRAVTLMIAEPATASVIFTKRIPVTAICSLAASQFDVLLLEFGSGAQEEHARLLTKARQVVQGPGLHTAPRGDD